MKPLVAVVGGFLGAGKTTLIGKAAQLLQARGVGVAAVLNDQGDDLVDFELMRQSGIPAEYVSGGCFCCKFPSLAAALERASARAPEVVFAEAVGSCTDLVATTLRPLMQYAGDYRIAPLTVLAHERPRDPDLQFLFDHQVAEADIVVGRAVDVEGWLAMLSAPGARAGSKSIEVDYRRYGEAEAALGWLNARAAIRPRPAASPAMVLGPLFERLDGALTEAGVPVVHMKGIARCESGYVKAAITANGREPAVEGSLDASPAREHDVLLNLRALGDPALLREIVCAAFRESGAGRPEVLAFRPAQPVPTYRLPVA